MTAHHAVLITNAVEVESFPIADSSAEPPQALLEKRTPQQQYNALQLQLKQLRSTYTQGQLSLEQLAAAEAQCYTALTQLREQLNIASTNVASTTQPLLDQLNQQLADKIFCNFSLFQSMPDVWAFEQIFPIMPLSCHHDEPTRRGIIQDLTCDSDGRIQHYVENGQIETTLRYHQQHQREPYYLGFFLLGAYQEILGDMHNLFGDTSTINIHLNEDGTSHYFAVTQGDAIVDLLNYVHIDPQQVERSIQQKMRVAKLQDAEIEQYSKIISQVLQAGSYLQ
jgi:arginine decarboxylase